MAEMLIHDEDSGLYIEKYLAKDLKDDVEFSPVVTLGKDNLAEKLKGFGDDEYVIISYSINSPKTILEIKSCNSILDDF